jgi:uncharacterized protein YpmB
MKGIKIPVGVSNKGGAATISADENDAQIISVALGSTDNENAFQQEISLGESMVFDLNDQSIRAKITRRLVKLFEEFRIRKRFELKKETISWETNSDSQELILTFHYVNLESDEDKFFRKAFSAST